MYLNFFLNIVRLDINIIFALILNQELFVYAKFSKSTSMKRVYIIEDQFAIVLGIQAFLNQAKCKCTVAGYSKSVNTAISEIQENLCDVIILDLFINRTDPLLNLKEVRTKLPNIPVIVYSCETSVLWRWRVFKEGVSGFVNKDTGIEDLVYVLHRVIEGEVIMPQDLKLFFNKMKFKGGLNTLRIEDLDIIRFKELGYKNTDIANIIHKSLKAVEKRLQKLCTIFDVKTVNDLIQLLVNPSVFGRKIYC